MMAKQPRVVVCTCVLVALSACEQAPTRSQGHHLTTTAEDSTSGVQSIPSSTSHRSAEFKAPLPKASTQASARGPLVPELSGAVSAGTLRRRFYQDHQLSTDPNLRAELVKLKTQRPTVGLIALLRRHPKRAVDALVASGWHESPNIRRQVPALMTLLKLDSSASMRRFLKRSLTQEPDRDVRAEVAKSCAHLSDASLAPTLIEVLKHDRASRVRGHVAVALGLLATPQAAAPLRAALRDVGPTVRLRALEALRRIEGKAALEVIRALRSDPDLAVRYAAKRALRQLSRAPK
ncbi:MAG: hypothetical protein CMH53_04995 [Myxococcales bacterium]|nr:hypothetical protein [Myxococcales bacterium]